MSTTQAITNASIATSTAAGTSSTSSSSTSSTNGLGGLGEQDFLKMLVAQLQNQDPLNPSDPTDFTAQLAQFSSLEQLTNINTNLATMLGNSNSSTALNMIGNSVSYNGSSFSYSGNPVQLGYTLSAPATAVQLVIKDSSGNVVRTINGTGLTSGNTMLTWDGLNQNGNSAGSGAYTLSVQATGVNATSVSATPIVTSVVTGANLNSSGSASTVLNTANGDISLSKILGVYTSK